MEIKITKVMSYIHALKQELLIYHDDIDSNEDGVLLTS